MALGSLLHLAVALSGIIVLDGLPGSNGSLLSRAAYAIAS
jgi:hypothetical protein